MKALKHIGGILLAVIGTLACAGCAELLFEKDSQVPAWGAAVMMMVLGVSPLAGAMVLLRRRVTELPPRKCPACGSVQRAPAGVLTRSYNYWLMHFGGWLVASLWGASREQQVRCVGCDTLYFTETRGTRIAGILLWILLLLILFGLIADHFQERP